MIDSVGIALGGELIMAAILAYQKMSEQDGLWSCMMLNSECFGHHSTFHGLTFIKLCVCLCQCNFCRASVVSPRACACNWSTNLVSGFFISGFPNIIATVPTPRHQSGQSGLDKSALALLISIFCISSSCRILSP